MLSPQQQAAQNLKQKLGGTGLPSAPPKPPGVMKSIGQGIGDFWNGSVMPLVKLPNTVYNATKTLGQGLTVGSATQNAINQRSATDQQNYGNDQQAVINAIHAQTDPVKKQRLIQFLNTHFSGAQLPSQGEINPATQLTTKQVVGSATQLAALAAGGAEGSLTEAGISPYITNATIGAGYMGGNAAANNASNTDIAIQSGIGALGGAALTYALPKALETSQHPIFKRTNPIMDPATVQGSQLNTAQQKVSEAQSARPESFMTQEQQMALDRGQGGVNSAQTNLDQVQNVRQQATGTAVKGANDLVSGVKSTTKNLGTNFGEKIATQELANPNTKATLTQQQVDRLNGLKENRDFILPDNLDQEKLSPTTSTGKPLNFSDPAARAKFEAQMGKAQGETATSLSRSQMKDLLVELNRSTYKETPQGLQVDNQRIGITKEMRALASKTFGSEFDQAYAEYSKGINSVNELKTAIGMKGKVPLDKILARVNKLGETPEGQAILQQYIDNVAKETGADFTDPVAGMHQLLDQQAALEQAQSQLSEAQKALDNAKKEVSTANKQSHDAQVKEAQSNLEKVQKDIMEKAAKGSYGKQMITAMKSPQYLARIIERAVLGVGILYPTIRAIMKAIKGK